ncbi:FAD-binding oxidoreductase [Streptomyces sp. NBC_00102]|uniref:FAD-binding oxidoreductase n=1 Tax=Streptomyces sp. NBC_00102 TaxID=2975652 RepID=UPI002250F12D|nr:FAD-dependent oxidoreductase [Streptomyces sp. NBC_00102]MCX5399889.1 FAD-dependent oxidoreductase [Streptomyces sp. NBC_00102]
MTTGRNAGGTVRWDELTAQVEGTVVLPSDQEYAFAKQGILEYFDSISPRAVVYCASAADVSATVRFARRHHLPVRPRSGGHNLAGWSTGEGVVVDLSRMNGVVVGPSTVRIGPGAQSIDALTELAAHGKQIITGTCPTVCAGGYLSGGGIGLQTRKFGIGSDRVVAARVVLADGREVRVSATEHPDLFWAVRGGGGGVFGIVVEFEVEPIDAPTMVYYNTMWPWEKALEVVTEWQEWCARGSVDLGSVLSLLVLDGAAEDEPMVQINGGYHGDEAGIATALDELAAAVGAEPLLRTVEELPYDQAMKHVYGCETITVTACHREGTNPEAVLPRQPYMHERTRLLARPTGATAAKELLDAFSADLREGQGRNLYLMALGGVANEVGRTDTAYVHRDAEFFVAFATLLWTSSPSTEEEEAAEAWPTRGFEVVDPLSTGGTYLNFPNPDVDDWQAAYHGENYARLAEVKRSYDPDNFFKHPQSITG